MPFSGGGGAAASVKFAWGGCCGEDSLDVSNTRYHQPNGMDKETADINKAKAVVPFAATIKNLYVKVWNLPGAGKTWDIMVMKNNAVTTLTAQIDNSSTDSNDTSNTFTVAAGDTLSIRVVPAGNPLATFLTWGFELEAL